MSSFVVDDETINKITSFVTTDHQNPFGLVSTKRDLSVLGYDLRHNPIAVDDLGRAMFALNVQAVNARYGDGQAAQFRALDFVPAFVQPQSPARTLKSLQCWLYQCTEGDVPSDPLYKAMTNFANNLAQAIVDTLPEYHAAPWG